MKLAFPNASRTVPRFAHRTVAALVGAGMLGLLGADPPPVSAAPRSRLARLSAQQAATVNKTSQPAATTGVKAEATAPEAEAKAEPREQAAARGSVAIIEYRTDARQMSDLPARLGQALAQNTSLQVVSLTDARRRLGASVDAEVAKCNGDTVCLSAIGQQLGVREVLLLAVSQLGDVVLALQRIEVGEHRVIARFADSLVTGQTVDEARVLGWLQQLYPPETFNRYGHIRITTDTEGAQVYLNSKARGKTPLTAPLDVLAPGNYRLLVEKDKFLPFAATLSVMPDTTVEVSAALVLENKPTPWYRRWYVWAGLGAGALAIVASGVAIKLATDQPAPDMSKLPGSIVFR